MLAGRDVYCHQKVFDILPIVQKNLVNSVIYCNTEGYIVICITKYFDIVK